MNLRYIPDPLLVYGAFPSVDQLEIVDAQLIPAPCAVFPKKR